MKIYKIYDTEHLGFVNKKVFFFKVFLLRCKFTKTHFLTLGKIHQNYSNILKLNV